MATLDTNLILDYVLSDIADISPEFQRILNTERLTVPVFVFLEVGYVLLKVYRFPRQEVVEILEGLLRTPWLKTNRPLLQAGLAMFEMHPKLSLVDSCLCYFARYNQDLPVYTRDKKLANQSGGMAHLVP